MGKKAAMSKSAIERKEKQKDKEIKLPASMVGLMGQTAPPNQACAWKRCSAAESQIQKYVKVGLLQEELIGWRSGYKDA
jgi:hypothetical protein